jgi:hypothetical protein
MRHARAEALERLDSLLAALREIDGLREKSNGIFYRGSTAFLHFHEDPAGLFADVRLADDFERHAVTTKREQHQLLTVIRRSMR